ncbi:MAG: hypothetical protein AABX07_04500 [Nanoarchaeota archaeon]
MDNCITCSSQRCSSPDRKLRTKCATSYAVFCNAREINACARVSGIMILLILIIFCFFAVFTSEIVLLSFFAGFYNLFLILLNKNSDGSKPQNF